MKKYWTQRAITQLNDIDLTSINRKDNWRVQSVYRSLWHQKRLRNLGEQYQPHRAAFMKYIVICKILGISRENIAQKGGFYSGDVVGKAFRAERCSARMKKVIKQCIYEKLNELD